MADDVVFPIPDLTTVAADEVGGKKYQRVKISVGADGSAADNDASNPIHTALTAAQLSTLTPPAAITGFATATLQGGGLPLALGAGGGVKIDGSGTALPVSGTVTVNALPAGTNNIGDVDILTIAAGDNNIGNVDIVTVPTDPFGANADAASATGSISAKLRAMATAWGGTALDLGSGTGGSRTLRFFKDTAQWIGGSGAVGSAVQRVTVATDDTIIASLATKLDAIVAQRSAGSDGSSTITAGGTAQNLFSAATPTNGFAVYNPDPSEDLWISLSTTAVANGTGCIRIAANGGGYESPPNMKPFSSVSIVGATTGHKFTAIKW